MKLWKTFVVMALAAGCAVQSTGQADRRSPQPQPQPTASKPAPSNRQVDPAVVERLQRVMLPLIAKMNKPLQANQVKVGIMDDPHINAASAGGGEFYVTTGLLEKANDDLGHVAKAQRLGAGLSIGAVLLDQIIPGSGAVTPIAGQLIARSYSRKEEYEADKHGAEILQRAGYPKDTMVNTLTWLEQTEGGGSGGGFFATHPATGDRIEALKKG